MNKKTLLTALMFGDGGSSGGGSTTTIYDGNVTIVDQPVIVNISSDIDPAVWTVTLGGHELEYHAEYNGFSWEDENTNDVYTIWYEGGTWYALVYDGNDDPIPGTYALNIVAPSSVIEITANGIADVSEYAAALVNVPASAVVSGTKQITANGSNIDVTNYAAVDVNVGGSIETIKATIAFTSVSYGQLLVPNVVENGQIVTKKLTASGSYTYDIIKTIGPNNQGIIVMFTRADGASFVTATAGHAQYTAGTGLGVIIYDTHAANQFTFTVTADND